MPIRYPEHCDSNCRDETDSAYDNYIAKLVDYRNAYYDYLVYSEGTTIDPTTENTLLDARNTYRSLQNDLKEYEDQICNQIDLINANIERRKAIINETNTQIISISEEVNKIQNGIQGKKETLTTVDRQNEIGDINQTELKFLSILFQRNVTMNRKAVLGIFITLNVLLILVIIYFVIFTKIGDAIQDKAKEVANNIKEKTGTTQQPAYNY
jgi:hypothetical protein